MILAPRVLSAAAVEDARFGFPLGTARITDPRRSWWDPRLQGTELSAGSGSYLT